MIVNLFPRLDSLAVHQCLESLDELINNAGLPLTEERMPASTSRTAIGGAQVSIACLRELRDLLVGLARQCGFPERGSAADRAQFDRLATIALADFEALRSGEADRDEVWAFIATVLAPDVAAWRFVNRSAERFQGGIRNTFQRLWVRAWSLDLGRDAGVDRWKLVEALTEDAMVALTERTAIASDRELSQAIARAWIATADKVGRARMEDIMRKAIISIRIRNEIQFLSALSREDLFNYVSDVFNQSVEIPPSVGSDAGSGMEPRPRETGSSEYVSIFGRLFGRK